MSAPPFDAAGLPDPDDKQLAWWQGEPAMLVWWRRIMESTTIAEEVYRVRDRYHLHGRYAHAVPTMEALNTVAALGPLVEIGAGSGYWARLLRDMDCDIAAFDHVSPEENIVTVGDAWTSVGIGDVDMLDRYPDRTVFVCWPERPHGFMPDLLERAPQTTLALLTDGPIPAAKGGDPMYDRLYRDWTLKEEVAIPVWPSFEERLAVWVRRA
jgi:hypothetical protein